MDSLNKIRDSFDEWKSFIMKIGELFIVSIFFISFGIVLAEKKNSILWAAGFDTVFITFLPVVIESLKYIAIILCPLFLYLYLYTIHRLFDIVTKSFCFNSKWNVFKYYFILILMDSIFLYASIYLAYNYLGFEHKTENILKNEEKGSIFLNIGVKNFFWQLFMSILLFFKRKGRFEKKAYLLLIIFFSFWVVYNVNLIQDTIKPYFNVTKPFIIDKMKSFCKIL